ncbi:hypothetical protein PpBr36_00181 [Pyricularia pennisetigena]|uniref:hypothetical protein n=1 Tax=Pyricularia pennisetigena TaxID=1578925 RepID=UPI0011509561|nr:hypothetical protein PpBr36_00181 [Pyricularia pennisetigena]TLS29474.1 hypothetical protein PpBr36_00181 [Pyricularia pennisetigena]
MICAPTAEIFQKCHGDDEKVIQALFSLARKLHSCIIFIDEADAMLGNRKAGERRHIRAMLKQFLIEWDRLMNGLDSSFVMLATNRPTDLDPAVLRRAPERIHLDLSSSAQRSGILRLLLTGEKGRGERNSVQNHGEVAASNAQQSLSSAHTGSDSKVPLDDESAPAIENPLRPNSQDPQDGVKPQDRAQNTDHSNATTSSEEVKTVEAASDRPKADSKALDKAMCLIELEQVKSELLQDNAVIDARRRRGEDLPGNAIVWNVQDNTGVGQDREKHSFENLDTVKKPLQKVVHCQAVRLHRDRIEWNLRETSKAYREIKAMAGLKVFKEAIEEPMDLGRAIYDFELQGKERIKVNLDRAFLGQPGTGKTTAAKLFGHVLIDLGLGYNKEVVCKDPRDLISFSSAFAIEKTHETLIAGEGKVLIIDNASKLCLDASSSASADSDRKDRPLFSITDTLANDAFASSGQDGDRIFLAGEAQGLRDMFDKCHRGLRTRFSPDEAFEFPDYDPPELIKMVEAKLTSPNGRDIETLAAEIVGEVYCREGRRGQKYARLQVSTKELLEFLKRMLKGRRAGELVDEE